MHSMSTSDSRKIYIKTVCTTIYYTKGQTDGWTDGETYGKTDIQTSSQSLSTKQLLSKRGGYFDKNNSSKF